LQLPILQLEQHVRQEVEQNPMLDESSDEMIAIEDESDFTPTENLLSTVPKDVMDGSEFADHSHDYDEPMAYESEHHDPFDFYETAWNDTKTPEHGNGDYDDDDSWGNDQGEVRTFTDDLIEQINVLNLTDQERLVCYTIIGNLEDDGYLRRSLEDIVDDVNTRIMEENHKQHRDYLRRHKRFLEDSLKRNSFSSSYVNDVFEDEELDDTMEEPTPPIPVPQITMQIAEKALQAVQQQDPPGIAARDLRECLLLQLHAKQAPTTAELLAKRILEKSYDVFIMKHYTVLCRQFSINEDELKSAIDAIRRLNPKPGGMGISVATSTVIPDFVISIDDDDDLVINVNDMRIPQLKLNKMYEDLKKEARYRKYNKETKEWLRKKYDDAKFLLQAIRQRKKTMLKVMTGIAGAQKDFFRFGESALKPLIYKDVADVTGMDVSTICRIVNGKYVQTDFGTYELRFFFSESLPSDDGEEISTTVIKQKIKELIEKEPKLKPHSDDKLMAELKKQGLNVARRTVAKYREQMRIPVARLRKEL
jgi:RNA polymerase sigma-54 factor